VLAAKAEDYVEAARALGNPHWRIALRHIFRTSSRAHRAGDARHRRGGIAEASLSFLGLGTAARAELGQHAQHRAQLRRPAPWMAIWPACRFSAGAFVHLLGDGLRDALDPRHR